MVKNICLLGSTGSIGVQTLDVCKDLKINVNSIVAKKNIALLEEQARKFKPDLVCVEDEKYYKTLKQNLKDTFVEVVCKKEGVLKAILKSKEMVLNAIVGINGFLPTIFALENKKDLALANKESLVVGGEIIVNLAKKNGCKILPVDSEHSAIFQCIQSAKEKEVKKIILTASGGPFFKKTKDFLKNVQVKDALNHPNWKMGKKISIDSATMANKGLELIEAMFLFNKKPQEIEIVINPQSVLHSAVEFVDKTILAQFSSADMRAAIQYALTYPFRVCSKIEPFSFINCKEISFFKPNYEMFPCLKFFKIAAEKKGLFPTILNAANEKAVELFLKGKIKFLDIAKILEKSLKIKHIEEKLTIDSILKTDILTKEYVENILV